MDKDILRKLEERLGPLHARQRLAIEMDHEAQVFGQGLIFFHLENLYSAPAIIRNALKLTGLYWRARRNAERIIVTDERRAHRCDEDRSQDSTDGFRVTKQWPPVKKNESGIQRASKTQAKNLLRNDRCAVRQRQQYQ